MFFDNECLQGNIDFLLDIFSLKNEVVEDMFRQKGFGTLIQKSSKSKVYEYDFEKMFPEKFADSVNREAGYNLFKNELDGYAIKIIKFKDNYLWKAFRELIISEYIGAQSGMSVYEKIFESPPCALLKYGFIHQFKLKNGRRQFQLGMVFSHYKMDLMDIISQDHFEKSYPVREYVKRIYDISIFIQNLGILHRDIKPENILVGYSLCLCDFENCLFVEESKHIIRLSGTLSYMSPEVILNNNRRNHLYTCELYSICKTIMNCLGNPSQDALLIPYDNFNGNQYHMYVSKVNEDQCVAKRRRKINIGWHDAKYRGIFKMCIRMTNEINLKYFEAVGLDEDRKQTKEQTKEQNKEQTKEQTKEGSTFQDKEGLTYSFRWTTKIRDNGEFLNEDQLIADRLAMWSQVENRICQESEVIKFKNN